MITLEKALALTGKHRVHPGTELTPLEEAMGRVLAEDVFSDRDIPPFSRATMDGYACRQEDLPGPLRVLESVPAGKIPSRTIGKDQCSRIMTGGMVPDGANCVIMQEYVQIEADGRIIFTTSESEANIHPRAQDLNKGDLLLPKGTRINPGHLGIVSSAGRTQLRVASKLNLGLLATGSELIEAEQVPSGAQIRDSNSHQLAGQIRNAGHRYKYLGIVEDNREILSERISKALEKHDLLVLTGGASVGELDLVPGVLKELGFHLEFQRVAIQPGKPITFAHRLGQVCFGLSGNPVSSFVQFELLLRPFLDNCNGAVSLNKRIRIALEKGYRRHRADRHFFLPVSFTDMGTCAPVEYHGSGHLLALAGAIGFAEMPPGQTEFKKGEKVNVRLI